MEEMLIECVRLNPILFDPTNRDYRNYQARKEAWDEVGEKLGSSGDECKETWTKLRNAYTQAKHRRASKSGKAAKYMGKWKYEDEMSFLNPTFQPRKTRRNRKHYLDYDNYAMKEETPEEIDLQSFSESDSQSDSGRTDYQFPEDSKSNILENSQIQISGIPAPVKIIENPTAQAPKSLATFAQPSEPPDIKTCLESSVQEMISIMKDNQRLHSEPLQTASAPVKNNLDDECELFFLSLAKTVKKLPPEEQIRVKMEVSHIVLGAELQACHNR